MREAFDKIDLDRSGFLDTEKIAAVIRFMGLDASESEVLTCVSEINSGGAQDNRITVSAFLSWWKFKGAPRKPGSITESISESIRGAYASGHTQYKLEILSNDSALGEHPLIAVAHRRYSQFDALRTALLVEDPVLVAPLAFPGKVWVGRGSEAVTKERRDGLERWVCALLRLPLGSTAVRQLRVFTGQDFADDDQEQQEAALSLLQATQELQLVPFQWAEEPTVSAADSPVPAPLVAEPVLLPPVKPALKEVATTVAGGALLIQNTADVAENVEKIQAASSYDGADEYTSNDGSRSALRVDGLPDQPFNGSFQSYADMDANGFPRYTNPVGKHLYRQEKTNRWLFNNQYGP